MCSRFIHKLRILGKYFHNSCLKLKYPAIWFQSSWFFKVLCTGRRVSLNINKFILHFKLSSGTLAKKLNDINISILDYSFIKFQIKLYIVTERFLWNSNISIWLCNHERNFGQINLLQKFLRILIIVKNNAKILELKQWKYDHNQQ